VARHAIAVPSGQTPRDDLVVLGTEIVIKLLDEESISGTFECEADGPRYAVAFVTIGEMYRWAARESGRRRTRTLRVEHLLDGVVRLPCDQRVIALWGDLLAEEDAADADAAAGALWIVASCLTRNLKLATLHRDRFERWARKDSLTLVGFDRDRPGPGQ
jgi:predicted nucleic acid-binding protein